MRRRALISSLLLAGLLAGCGGASDSDSSTVTVTSTSTQTTASLPAREKPPEKTRPPTLAEQAERVVLDYYDAVDAGRYDKAWSLLAPGLQSELGGYSAWKAGYTTTVSTRATGVNATDATSGSATVALQLRSTDLDQCGDTVGQTFAGSWSLTRSGTAYLGSAFNVDKTGGATPATDASSCAGGTADAPVVAGCDPNYAGACVPPYPPDVDCIDIRHEVVVIGDDVHNLDLGGDNKACEIWPK